MAPQHREIWGIARSSTHASASLAAGAMETRGRRPSENPRSRLVKLRLVEAERQAWALEAERRGLTMSEMIRTAVNTSIALQAPKRILRVLHES